MTPAEKKRGERCFPSESWPLSDSRTANDSLAHTDNSCSSFAMMVFCWDEAPCPNGVVHRWRTAHYLIATGNKDALVLHDCPHLSRRATTRCISLLSGPIILCVPCRCTACDLARRARLLHLPLVWR